MKLLDNLEQNYRDTMEQKGVQIVFCDIAINEDSEHFSVYEAIKSDLVKRGIPREEICFAGDAQTDKCLNSSEMAKSVSLSLRPQSWEQVLMFRTGFVLFTIWIFHGSLPILHSRTDEV